MPETALTSALNATVLTCNGNEGLILNDMGNTLIKDSITGNVMSLRDGFIPLGMKERGGILYIASYNPQTKEGELGSIPSPVINYTYLKEDQRLQSIDISDLTGSGNLNERINTGIIYLSDKTFHAGDKFIPILNIENINEKYPRSYINSQYPELYPYVSTVDLKGWYKIKLYAVSNNGTEFPLDNIMATKQQYLDSTGTVITSDYWYVNSADENFTEIDPEATKISDYYRTFPNVRAGKLAIKVEPELHEKLEYTKNDSYENNYPSVYITSDSEIFVVINGLKYKGSCGIQPDKIEIIVNGLENPDLYKYQNGSFVSCQPQFEIGIELDQLKTTKSGDTFFISNKQFTDEAANIINYNSDSLQYQICAIPVDNFMQAINVQVKLYVRDLDGNYVYYRTDSLPSFTPAEVELGLSNAIATSVDQYYKKKDDSGSFDILLFNNITDNDLRCFIYSLPDGHILKYNNTTKLYEPIQKPNSLDFYTVDDYKEIKTWIYPLYGVKVNGDGETQPYGYGLFNSKVALIAPFLYLIILGSLGRKNNIFFNKDNFVVCSELPQITVTEGTENKTIPLVLPVSFTQADLDLNDPLKLIKVLNIKEEHLKLRNYFSQHKNSVGLTPFEVKQHCLFNVNLEILKNGVNLPFRDNRIDEAGIYYGSVANSEGMDRFWDTEDLQSTGDTTLCISPNRAQVILHTDGQGLIHVPTIISQRTTSSTINFFNYSHCNADAECDHDASSYISFYEFYADYGIKNGLKRLATEGGSRTAGKFNAPFDHEYYPGCLNTEISLCPGYFTNNFSLKFKLFLYPYSSKYLYNSTINCILHNLGDQRVSYFKLLGTRLWWGTSRSMHFGLQDDKFTLLLTLTVGGIETTYLPQVEPVDESTLSSKIELNENSILNSSVRCSILPEDTTYDFKYALNVVNANTILGRQLVVTPQIFLQVGDNELNRTYRSNYQITRQFDIGENGFYNINGKKYVLVKSNIDISKNYLNSSESIPDDETLLIYGIDGQTPEEIEQVNSFCFSQGYLKLYKSNKKDSNPTTISNLILQDITSDITPRVNTENASAHAGTVMRVRRNSPSVEPSENTTSNQIITYPILEKTITLNSGIYVIHINHNGAFVGSGETVNFFLTIDNDNNSTVSVYFTDDYVAFYVKDDNTNIHINLTCNTASSGIYIKNVGLYRVITPAEFEDRWTLIEDDYKYLVLVNNAGSDSIHFYSSEETRGIIFPAAFCFKELYDDNTKIGCLDWELDGFLSLPSHSYQRCVGNYQISRDRKASIISTPYCDQVYARTIIPDGTIIQTLRS